MALTSIRFSTAPFKPKPRVGDTKVVKGKSFVRQLKYVTDCKGRRLGLDCTGGRQRYEWVEVQPKPEEN